MLSAPLALPPSAITAAVPFLELAALAGYSFVPACASLLAHLMLGEGALYRC